MQVVVAGNKAAIQYRYGLRVQHGPDSQPAGFINHIPLANARALVSNDERDYLGGIVVYDRPLNFHELDQWRLVDLNTSTETDIWNTFVTFVRDIRRRSPNYTLQQFVRDYLNPEGPRAAENPLYEFVKPQSAMIFGYLRKFTDHSPNYIGLEAFWATHK